MDQSIPALPPQGLGPRPSLIPFLADHHLPYLVPAVFYWLIGKSSTRLSLNSLIELVDLVEPRLHLSFRRKKGVLVHV